MATRVSPAELIPAPGRGQYDRRQPRERRLSEQRERLVAATARAVAASETASVAEIVSIAGVGRNTFYEFFDDVAHARKAAESMALQRVEEALRAAEGRARTPVERFRALAQAWFEVAEATPAELLIALRAPALNAALAEESRSALAAVPTLAQGLSPAGAAFAASLVRSAATQRALGIIAADREPLRTRAVAASAEAFGRGFAQVRLSKATESARGAERAGLERALVDVAVRLLR